MDDIQERLDNLEAKMAFLERIEALERRVAELEKPKWNTYTWSGINPNIYQCSTSNMTTGSDGLREVADTSEITKGTCLKEAFKNEN